MMLRWFKDFIALEAASGIALILAAVLAMGLANSPYSAAYTDLFAPLSHSINDGLMAIFFLLVGLEVKRECQEGELQGRKMLLPLVAALGGVVAPAVIYLGFNGGTAFARGWAIPSATDIAFSLGVLTLFGPRVPAALKIFLMAVAVIDDVAAVIIIALFYTSQLHFLPLLEALACAGLIYMCARKGVMDWCVYVAIGIVMWAATLQSGVHATVAGVALGLLIPLPLGKKMIHAIHPYVAFGILPIFALANAGIPLAGIAPGQLSHPVTFGIIVGLVVGKQLGIFTASWLMVKLRFAQLPEGVSWRQFYAMCAIAGIGFTMSLFIGLLALPGQESQLYIRLGVVVGSLVSGVVGALLMFSATRKHT